jgi:uncharacterized protein (DUF302 family)
VFYLKIFNHSTNVIGMLLLTCPLQIKEEPGSFLVTLPCKIAAWDMDKNGSISMNEFAFAGHAAVKDKNTNVVLSKIDKNGKY